MSYLYMSYRYVTQLRGIILMSLIELKSKHALLHILPHMLPQKERVFFDPLRTKAIYMFSVSPVENPEISKFYIGRRKSLRLVSWPFRASPVASRRYRIIVYAERK